MQLKSRVPLKDARPSLSRMRPLVPSLAASTGSSAGKDLGDVALLAGPAASVESDEERWATFLAFVGLIEACVRFDVSNRSENGAAACRARV
jgi:hypothetical protein